MDPTALSGCNRKPPPAVCASSLFPVQWAECGEIEALGTQLAAITLLTIDLDDTLWPCAPVIQAAEDALYAWLTEVAERLVAAYGPDRLREHRRGVLHTRPGIAHDLTEVRRQSLRGLLQGFGYDPGLADRGVGLFLEHRNRVRPYADVVPNLVELKGRYRLVSITNGNAEVARTSLRGVFDLSLTAAEVGAARPDPRLFTEALRAAAVDPSQALHAGDDPRLDVAPARAVGMRTAWVNRQGREWPLGLLRPDVEVEDFWQLRQWLEQQGT